MALRPGPVSRPVARSWHVRNGVVVVAVLAALTSGPGMVTPARAVPGTEAPASVVAPTEVVIGGTVAVGGTGTAEEGLWEPPGTTFEYQWRSDGADIEGATGRQFGIPAQLEGTYLTVAVTGTGPDESSETRVSAPVLVAAGQFAVTRKPIVSGVPRVGRPLTASTGSWTPAAGFAYQWSAGATPITGATGTTYTPTTTDVGKQLTVSVTGSSAGYASTTETSQSTAPVVAGVFDQAPIPTLTGAVRVGSTVTAQPGTWAPAATFVYQWRRDGATIAGATARTYRPVAGDRGRTLSVRVTAQRPGYASQTRTSGAATVGAGVFAAAPLPRITGSTRVGAVLTAVPGTWSPTARVAYRWLRNGVSIPGATAATYRLTSADHGKRITVRATAARSGYASASRTSAATTVIVKPFTTVAVPTITGTARVGSTLTADVRAWTPSATVSYQWKRGGVAIAGATGRTYRLVAADHQRAITVTVTGKRTAYISTARTSRPTASVAPPRPTVTRDGTFRVGAEIGAGTYVSQASSDFCYWERRSYAGDDFEGIIANDLGGGQRIVRIASTDRYFTTSGCGSWTRLVPLAVPRVSVGGGMVAVGEHLRPGLYEAPGTSTCYWARLSGFSGDLDDVIDNHFGAGQQYVQIYGADAGFVSDDCGTWRRVGD
ncbi:hypothetical protein [Blastococcus goldschmidtiae]|uniref:Uncharacterized protein n=1 Tax=Blastococcus goldschmidtiae TaxID=3075546 RepID=A0ABU2K3A3_9ACTN|nr:hypothetical protein [Blastococcus sp. DSM 46792]MDT0274672.1 hypothetical protein [Blastococcus sp. DSM 46792]